MSSVRPLFWSLALVVLPAFNVIAQDKPATQDAPPEVESVETVKKEYAKARESRLTEMRSAIAEARKKGTEKSLKFDKESPRLVFSRRFLAIAEKSPEGPQAIDALKMTLQTSGGLDPVEAREFRTKVFKVVRDHHAAKPSIEAFLSVLARSEDDDAKALVAYVLAKNPDRKIQVAVYKEQIAMREELAAAAESLTDPTRLKAIEKAQGKQFVKDQLARAELARKELDGLRKTLREKYSDLMRDRSIGSIAPEIKSQTLDGKETSLEALRGKVVVLDIWATWCGPCVAMIPHERDMVERLKDKPFALVSISADEKKETLIKFLAEEKMPWTHWWNGSQGGVVDDWDVQYFPTIYVLDSEGVIRHKDIRGEALEKAVNALLAETANASKH